MNPAVLMPAGTGGDPWRAQALEWIRGWWWRNFPEVPLHLGDVAAGEPWSKGAAIADALERAGSSVDLLILADADSFTYRPADLAAALELVDSGEAPWVVPHRFVYRLRDKETARLHAARPELLEPRLGWTARPRYEGPPGGGITVLTRDAFETAGGIDRRFLGWGGEDVSFGWALETLVAPLRRLDAELVHLWHPHPAPNLRGSPESEALVARYRDARGVPRRMRAVIAGEEWHRLDPLPNPVTFRMIANRQYVRLASGEVLHFIRNTYTTNDPDEVEQLRLVPTVAEERRR